LIGVDLGTSATKAALYKPDGTLVAEASLEVPLYYPRPGVVEQENDDFYTTAAAAVRRCVQQSGIDPRQVAAIAFDSQMAGIGSVDEDFRPATRFDSWLDMRCKPYIEQMDRQAGARVTELSGCAPTCDGGPKMLWWMHERPQEFKRIVSFLTPSAFVAGTMAGLKGDQAFMDYTFIHFAGFSDSQSLRWSDELCETFCLPREKLPEIVEPWKVIGEVTPAAAKDFDLAPGTVIAAGCGDTAANALGAGVVKPGMVYDTAGTAAVLAACTDRFVADLKYRALICMHSVIPGLYHPLAYIAGGGIALRWFRDQFYNTLRGQPVPADLVLPDGENLYEAMIAAATQVPPGADGLLFSTHLGGRICPSAPEMRGAWVGFTWSHTQAHFFRAILESIAYEYAFYLSVLKEQLPNVELTEARAVGGGARSSAWTQIKADVLNLPYQRLQRSEFGTWGSAMIAGKAVGLYTDLAQVAQEAASLRGGPVHPDPATRQAYDRQVQKYIGLQDILLQHFRD
jgi:xylulokinase